MTAMQLDTDPVSPQVLKNSRKSHCHNKNWLLRERKAQMHPPAHQVSWGIEPTWANLLLFCQEEGELDKQTQEIPRGNGRTELSVPAQPPQGQLKSHRIKGIGRNRKPHCSAWAALDQGGIGLFPNWKIAPVTKHFGAWFDPKWLNLGPYNQSVKEAFYTNVESKTPRSKVWEVHSHAESTGGRLRPRIWELFLAEAAHMQGASSDNT